MRQKFLKCNACGKIIHVVKDSQIVPTCCGKDMVEIIPGTVDASVEKHLPVFEDNDGKIIVSVGSVEHPMTPEHLIEWVLIETDKGVQRIDLKAGDKPVAVFHLTAGDSLSAVYAYCNLHGLWASEPQERVVCEYVKPKGNENYVVCKCNNVTVSDIIEAVHNGEDIASVLKAFDKVKDTTRCSTNCGGCYDKVIDIISKELS